MNLADNFKGILNASTITRLLINPTKVASLPIHLVILEFEIGQGVVFVIVEFDSLYRGKLKRGSTIRIAQMSANCIASCAY
jgi:hypothetical protein